MDVYFWALLFSHLLPSAGVPHPAAWDQRSGHTQLMTRPSYQLMVGEDGKLVPMSPSFSLFPQLTIFSPSPPRCHSLYFLLVHGHQFLYPLGISQLTYSGCKCAKKRDEQRRCLALSICECGKERVCVSVALGEWMSELSSLALISEKSICCKCNC